MVWSRLTIIAVTLVGLLTGCSLDNDPVRPKPGTAARKITVIRGNQTYPVTAEVTGWEIKPHPQVPDQGVGVHFTYRFATVGQQAIIPETSIEIQACAVDSHRVVILCDSIYYNGVGDEWVGPDQVTDLARTTGVVLLPNQMFPGLHVGDPKDHDGYVPPRVGPGDQL